MNVVHTPPELVAQVLNAGGVAVIPTDTVYGLSAVATSPQAVRRMYEIKRRDGKPGTIIAASIEQLIAVGFDTDELMQGDTFWPGAVSVIVASPLELSYLDMGLKSLAVRVPDNIWLYELLMLTGPLATTSANLPGEPTVSTVVEAQRLFGNEVTTYVDGGDMSHTSPSKIIKIMPDGSVERIR